MLEKPLNRAELDVLEVLRQHHALHGPVERTALSVEVRGRGLEFGRALARLITLGLAEEFIRKPFFLKRLFGAKSVLLLRPTAAGLAEATAPTDATETPLAAPDDTAARLTPQHGTAASLAKPAPVTPPPLGDPTSTADSTSVPIRELAPPVQSARPQTPDAGPTVRAPGTVDAPHVDPSRKPKPAKAKPRPKPITAFTEDLGGTPLPLAAPALPASVDAATLDGLRETLSVMGLDLTPAGEALAAHRIAKGATPAEALSQVVLFAFAHAVSQDLYSGGPIADLGLRDYATEVLAEVAKLCTAGELSTAAFDHDKAQLWGVLNDSLDREANVRILLCDPMGGAAPPAVLPEDLRRSLDE